jgi:RNA polymerase sigma-70 factor (ECF subfamily)
VDHACLLAALPVDPSAVRGRSQTHAVAERRLDAIRAITGVVYRVVAAILGPASPDVGDVTNEAFLRIYDGIATFAPDGPDGASRWVKRIARNAAIDVRKLSRSLRDAEDESPQESAAAPVALRIEVADLLNRLEPHERALLVMRYWEQLGTAEISEQLGLPEGTVKTAIRRLLHKLRASLTKDGVRSWR